MPYKIRELTKWATRNLELTSATGTRVNTGYRSRG